MKGKFYSQHKIYKSVIMVVLIIVFVLFLFLRIGVGIVWASDGVKKASPDKKIV